MAEGVVARLAHVHVAGPGAARAALVGVVAGAAEAPEIGCGAIARVAKLLGVIPEIAQRALAGVAPGVVSRRQRGAALHRAVALDAHRARSCGAPGPVEAGLGAAAAQ